MSVHSIIVGDTRAVVLPPLQSPLRSRPEESDGLLPGFGALAYQPIDSENGEIRLIKLLPGRYDDEIQLNLYTENLKYRPSYEALSYAWGTAPSLNRAIVNGFPVPVREGLDLGLRRLRLVDRSRTLWVDALCINQSDVRERSHQVQQMSMIYKSAEQVVVWLGEWPDLETCPNSRECQTMFVEWLNDWPLLLLSGEYVNQMKHSRFSWHLCQHALEISKLPWFRRLWIILEFVLAASRKFVLGTYTTSSDEFLNFMTECLDYLPRHLDSSLSDCVQAARLEMHLSMLQAMENRFYNDGRAGLYEYSVMSRYAMATDPRDRIYGLLGMTTSYMAEPMVPDYSKAWSQILAEATIVMISEAGLFPYMSDGFAFPSADRLKEGYCTPSWVLDFAQSFGNDVSIPFATKYNGHKLDADETERRRKSLRLSEDFRTLYKHGWYVGTIRKTFVFTTKAYSREITMESTAGLHDFYHQVLKPKGIAPDRLYEAVYTKLHVMYTFGEFLSYLLGHRDEFRPRFSFDRSKHINKFAVFVTERGDVGATWLNNTVEIRADDVLVCLFERQMPFILRPLPGGSTYRMVNLAYVQGLSGAYIQFHSEITWGRLDEVEQVPNDWIHDAAEGCREYAIV
ncbi:hypothetical protein AG0111_0g3639 [Alternaria gaisen]|uniref:Uncharacterized protein n=1 Tax=Alternaria gaisen TaxID=167740 RepID=A0ACB6FS64_9PLEO|nr:hypothetical protein AG0111_0g3639 [Alternaria gaisen]